MTLPVVFTEAARADVLEAFDWYEARQDGLGQRFTDELDALAGRIGRSPLQFPLVHGPVRRGLLRRFPYGVFFRLTPVVAQVIACLHTARDPATWRDRA